MSLLSDYQRAALEVMGIPVWVSQSEMQPASRSETAPVSQTAAETPSTASATASHEERAAKLAALRAQVSSDKTSAPASDSRSVNENQTSRPASRSLSAQETQAAGALLNDIQLAARSINFTQETLAFEIGGQLAVNQSRITLPCAPAELSASDKRALWKALSQA